MEQPKRMLCSLLFTDIVSSTETGDSPRRRGLEDLLGRHHAIVRHELGRFGGAEVDTAGDGFLATFDVRDLVMGSGIEFEARGVHTP